jgi:hypothetical protein
MPLLDSCCDIAKTTRIHADHHPPFNYACHTQRKHTGTRVSKIRQPVPSHRSTRSNLTRQDCRAAWRRNEAQRSEYKQHIAVGTDRLNTQECHGPRKFWCIAPHCTPWRRRQRDQGERSLGVRRATSVATQCNPRLLLERKLSVGGLAAR